MIQSQNKLAAIIAALLLMFSFTLVQAQTHRGRATYYSKRATGARTASGERLHHDSLTCAHRRYPFGTKLKVTNLSNGKSVIVKVNDRGPFRRGVIIDLSYGAAKAIGMLSQGIAPVEVEKVRKFRVPLRSEEDEVEAGFADFDFDFGALHKQIVKKVTTPKIDKKRTPKRTPKRKHKVITHKAPQKHPQ